MSHVLRTNSGMFYTGRAGDAWVSSDRAEAFSYSGKGEADRKVSSFNRMSRLHGHTFFVEEV